MVTGLIKMCEHSLNVIFFGNNLEVLECLNSIANIVAVFAKPDDGTDENINSVKRFSVVSGIPFFQPSKKELYGYADYITDINPDLIIVCGYKFIIPREIFSIPKDGTINIHPSMLPRYRGQHVINWAIINGESETGVTLHFMEETLDSGAIIAQKSVPIFIEDTAKDLHDRVYLEACDLLEQVLLDYKQGRLLYGIIQDLSEVSFFKPRKPEDGHIDWSKGSKTIYDLIRGVTRPWPGAYSYISGRKVIIWKAVIGPAISEKPYGKVFIANNNNIVVNTSDGQIIILDYDLITDDNSILCIKNGDLLT